MSLQYISNSEGETTGVFIPIKEWNALKSKYQGIENDELSIPEWHKNIVNERLASYSKAPNHVEDFDKAMLDIENELE